MGRPLLALRALTENGLARAAGLAVVRCVGHVWGAAAESGARCGAGVTGAWRATLSGEVWRRRLKRKGGLLRRKHQAGEVGARSLLSPLSCVGFRWRIICASVTHIA